MKFLTSLILGFIVIFFTACTGKFLHTKPSSFVGMQTDNNNSDIYCMNNNQEINATYSFADEPYRCENYISLDIANLFDASSNDINKTKTKLLYVADRNCQTFTNRFYTNYFTQEKAGEIIGLNLFGVSFSISSVQNLTASSFDRLKDNLEKNLKNRSILKKKIIQTHNYTKEVLLMDIMEYEKYCSLIPQNDYNVSDANISVSE